MVRIIVNCTLGSSIYGNPHIQSKVGHCSLGAVSINVRVL